MVFTTLLRRFALLVFSTVFSTVSINVNAQCALSNFNEGGTANVPPCGTFAQTQQGPGTYSTYTVVQGAQYEFSNCTGSGFDSQLTGYNAGGGGSLFTNDNNGPLCTGIRASVNWNSTFSGSLRLMVNRTGCLGWDGTGTSAVINYRQVNNISVTNSPTTACSGQTVQLVATPAGGTWSGTGVSNNNPSAGTASFSSTASQSVRYTLGQCFQEYTINVFPNAQQPTSVVVSPSNTICSGTQVTLSVNGGNVGGGVWRWYTAGCGVGTAVGTGPNLTVTPTATTTYFVRAEGGCSTPTGCASTTITVNTQSTAPTTINSNIPGNAVCPGAPITLSLGNGVLGIGSQWRWYSGSCGGVSVGTGPSITVNPTVATTYFVRAEGPCDGPNGTTCAQLTVNINTVSVAATGIDKSLDNFCPGSNTTLSVNGGSLGTGAQWVWYSGASCCGTPIASGQSSIVVSPTVTTNYYVRAEGGCGNTTPAQTTVTVKTESILPTSISASRDTTCAVPSATTVTLNLNGGILGTGASWELYSGDCPTNGGTFVASNTSGIFSVTPSTTTTYFVRAVGDCNTTGCFSKTIFVSSGVSGVNTTFTQPSCFNGNDGTATATPTGGLPPYRYSWSNGATTQTATGLAAGFVSVTVTDAGGCFAVGSTTLTQPSQLVVTNVSPTNVTCGGGSDGRIVITAIGGTTPLEYSIDGGNNYQPSNDFTGLTVGTYTISVRDNNGCTAGSSPASFTLTSPPTLSVSASGTDASCVGVNDGTITASASGGTGNIQYSINGSPLQPGGFFNNLSAGNYTVLAEDQLGCQATTTVVINNNATLSITIDNILNASCNGAADGSFEAIPNGGTAPYEYTINGFTFQQSGVFSNLTAGTYNVLVRDSRGCQNNTTVTITQPAALLANISNQINIGCFGGTGGSLTVNVSGGAPSYSFLWSDGQTTQTASGLLAGGYTVTVTDDNNCTVSTGATITEAPQLFLNLASLTDADCNGASEGRVDISVTGGTPPYNFAWSNGATTEDLVNVSAGNYDVTVTDGNGCTLTDNYSVAEPAAIVLNLSGTNPSFCFPSGSVDLTVSGGVSPYTYLWSNFETTEDISNLSGGTYTVIVTDANGCTSSSSATLIDPAGINVVETITNASCVGTSDGAIDITVTGGSGLYNFNWFDNNFNFIANTEDVSGLSAGVYNLDIFDFGAGFCFARYTFVIGENGPSVTGVVTDASCDASVLGSIDVSVTGGTSPYSYLWNTGATTQDLNGLLAGAYSITVTDDNGCQTSNVFGVSQGNIDVVGNITSPTCSNGSNGTINLNVLNAVAPIIYDWSNGANTQNISGLSAGTYVVSVTDGLGCIGVEVFTIANTSQITISQTSSGQGSSCSGAFNSVGISVIGGSAPYSYLWSNGATTQDLNNVLPGNYTVIVTDVNGCTATSSWQLGFPANPPTATFDVTNAGCTGQNTGAIDITLSFTAPPTTVSYLWSNGETTEDISNVGAGLYSLTVTYDACQQVFSAIIQNASPIAAVNMLAVNGDCTGATGSVTASPVGGAAPYTFAWGNGATTSNITGLVAGNYTVTVTSAEGCSATNSVNISQAGAFNLSASVTNADCNGASSASIFVTPLNATLPVTYAWSNGATTKDLLNVSAGTYSVTATDASGCIRVASYTVTQPSAIAVSVVNIQNADCANSITGSIDIDVTGGFGSYTYLWTNGATSQDITNLIAGSYTVIVTDGSGCSTTASYTVTDPSGLAVNGTAFDVSCNGANDGAVNGIVATGGTPGYTFLWSNGATTQDVSGLAGGVYAITVTDNVGCQATAGFVINEPDVISLSVSNTNVTCNGLGNGTINLVVNGGTAPYTYAWSNGATTEDLSGLSTGTYTVTVTDANNCSAVTSANISQPTVLSVSATSVNAACNGGNTGAIDLIVSGGLAPYSFSWSNGATSQNISNLAAGTYSVTVRDANNCTVSQSFNVNAPTPIVVSTTGTDADCANNILGSVDASVSGGTTPYLFSWNNGATTEDISGLFAGTYTLTVTDINGCTSSASYTVIDISSTLAVTGNVTDVSCPDANDGAIDVTVTGGTPTFNYTWGNGATTEDLSGLSAGNYGVTVVDAQGCGFFAGFTVDSPDSIVITANVIDGTCGGGPGSIDLIVSGGFGGPYAYQWSNGSASEDLTNVLAGTYFVTVTDANGCTNSAFFNVSAAGTLDVVAAVENADCNGGNGGSILTTVISGQPPYTYQWSTGDITSDILNLSAGSYIVTVSDAGGCVKVQTFTVSEPTQLQILASTVTEASCFGTATGSVDIIVGGGTAPYTYLWSNFDNTQDLSNVVAGVYTVIVTDANGCSISAQYNVGEADELVIAETITNVSCSGGNDGEISLVVTGGVSPYNYIWSNGATTATVSQLTVGIYSVTVSDANNCTITGNYSISEPSQLQLSANVSNVSCNAGTDGSVDLTVTGGTTPYTYSWSPGGATTQDLTAVSANQYTVIVTDANNCTVSAVYDVLEPSPLQVTASINDVTCNGLSNGSIDVTVTGGVSGYSYNWSNGLNTQDIVNVPAGNYTLTVTDANGCTAVVTYTVSEPAVLTANANIDDVNCFGGNDGAIDLTVSGGTPTYTYLWSNGSTTEDLTSLTAGIYGVTITDANSCTFSSTYTVAEPSVLAITSVVSDVLCNGGTDGSVDITIFGGTPQYSFNWSNGATTEDVTNLSAGTYTVTITDANGCTLVENATVNEPQLLTVVGTVENVTCFGASDGSVDLTVTGGVAPYTFAWDNNNSSEDINGLPGGTYNVTVTDANGCTVSDSYTVLEPTLLTATLSSTDVVCFGGNDGEIDLTVSGGTPQYTFNWSNGETTEDITTLVAGTYTVTITDANGCTLVQSATINEPDQILISTQTVQNVTCFNGNDGSIEITITGGTSPYTYAWSNGETTASIFNLIAGNYEITVLDVNNCGIVRTFTITQPDEVIANEVITNVLCNGNETGSIELNVTGGVSPYTFVWSNSQTTQSIFNLEAGIYSVTITDANLCTSTFTYTVTQPDELATQLTPTSATCSDVADGSIDLTVTGGVAPYTFFWSTFEFTEDISNLTGGRYVVIVTDFNGCTAIDSVVVDVPQQLAIVGIPKGAGCGNDDNGEIGVSVTGGTSPYTYLWSDGATTEDRTDLPAGQYCLTVTDANGCEATYCTLITGLPKPIADFTFNNDCVGESIQMINNTQLSSGTLTYEWTFGDGTSSQAPNPSKTYSASGDFDITLVARSDRGCLDTLTKTITIFATPDATITISGANPGDCVSDTAFLSVAFDEDFLYLWSNGATTNAITTTSSGNYRVTVTSVNGCVAVDAVDVFVLNQGNVSISNDTTVSKGFPALLTATGGSNYVWTPTDGLDSPTSASTLATPEETTTYTVTVSDPNGCNLELSVTVTVVEDFNLGIPNLISPNGDGINDVWNIFNVETYPGTSVMIFNRWGSKVWESSDYQNDWNGTAENGNELPDGTYFYVIQVGGSDRVFKGDVNILR